MDFIGKPLSGDILLNAHLSSIDECIEVKAAIAYAQKSTDKILLLEDCAAKGKKLTFYGRVDGTCPIDTRILSWFLKCNSPNVTCKLVPHWLHAKVIWWVGSGAYIGSANLTDRAWFQNYEAGIYLSHEELEQFGLIINLEDFFDGLELKSFPLTNEEYAKQCSLEQQREKFLGQIRKIEESFEDQHWNLKDRATPITIAELGEIRSKKLKLFQQEWSQTLQLIRSIGTRVSLDQNRPDWISMDVPEGVQGDQFLHAYYYQVVRPMSEKDAYLRDFRANRGNPEAALQLALAWWKRGDYEHSHEEYTIYESSRLLRAYLGQDKIRSLTSNEWVDALTRVYAFSDHAAKVNNAYLGLGANPGAEAKAIALANMLFRSGSTGGMSSLDVLHYVIWGPGDIGERLWRASNDANYKLPHIGANILGEMVGWARPTEFPPRNARTSKALCALGNDVSVIV